jgi:hypothetical protein
LKFREKGQQEVIKLVVQLNRVNTTKDGGTRLWFDCGAESLEAVQRIQTLNAKGDISLALAIVPFEGEP